MQGRGGGLENAHPVVELAFVSKWKCSTALVPPGLTISDGRDTIP